MIYQVDITLLHFSVFWFGLLDKIFGPPVFIYSVIWIRSYVPNSNVWIISQIVRSGQSCDKIVTGCQRTKNCPMKNGTVSMYFWGIGK